MKIYVGIDIAKLNHFAAAISSDGEIILEPFKFTNDADGFQLLVSKLESFDKNSMLHQHLVLLMQACLNLVVQMLSIEQVVHADAHAIKIGRAHV